MGNTIKKQARNVNEVDFMLTDEYKECVESKYTLRTLTRTRDDLVDTRKQFNGRLGRKADGKSQRDAATRKLNLEDVTVIADSVDRINGAIEDIEARILVVLEEHFPIWEAFFKDIPGIKHAMAAQVIAELNPFLSDKPSSFLHYAGYNPTYVFGEIELAASEVANVLKANPGWYVVSEYISPSGKEKVIVKTTNKIRADKRTKGYLLPYNGRLKTILFKFFTCLIRNRCAVKSHYITEVYPDRRNYYDNAPGWKYRSDGHRHNATIRAVMTVFLIDLHKAWRELYGLPVRPPYAEEKFGRAHGEVNNIIEIDMCDELVVLAAAAETAQLLAAKSLDQGRANSVFTQQALNAFAAINEAAGWKLRDEDSGKTIENSNARLGYLHDKVADNVNRLKRAAASNKSLDKKAVTTLFTLAVDTKVAVQNVGRVKATKNYKQAMAG